MSRYESLGYGPKNYEKKKLVHKELMKFLDLQKKLKNFEKSYFFQSDLEDSKRRHIV